MHYRRSLHRFRGLMNEAEAASSAASHEVAKPIIQLPPELLSPIVRHVFHYEPRVGCHDHCFTWEESRARKDLRACSEVSYAMRQATLPFLFHVVAISIAQSESMIRYCRSSDSESDSDSSSEHECYCFPGELDDVPALLADVPSVCEHVRELRVRVGCVECSGRIDYDCGKGAPEPLSGSEVFDIARMFSKLEVLDVQNTKLQFGSASMARPLGALESFNWGLRWQHMRPSNIAVMLGSVGKVGWVLVTGLFFDEARDEDETTPEPETHPTTINHPAEIEGIYLDGSKGIELVLETLRVTSAIQPTALRKLHLSTLSNSRDFVAFVHAYGANLTEVFVGITSTYWYG